MNNVTEYSQIQSYADDTQLLYSFDPKYYNDVEAQINTDLSNICLYSRRHGLRLNADKTKVLLFASNHDSGFLKNYIGLEMNGQRLVFSDTAKNLGVIYDTRLRFEDHISTLSKRIYVSLKVLYANKHILNFKVRKKLCEAYVFSKMSYCLILFYPCLTQVEKLRLQRMQNNCCRFIYGLRKYDHVSSKIQQLNWLNVENSFKYLFLVFVYKILGSNMPMYLRSKLRFRDEANQLFLRDRSELEVPRHTTAIFQRSFSFVAASLYNSFRTFFRSSDSISSFRKNIKCVLLSRQNVN